MQMSRKNNQETIYYEILASISLEIIFQVILMLYVASYKGTLSNHLMYILISSIYKITFTTNELKTKKKTLILC